MSDYKQFLEKQKVFFATGKTRDVAFRIEQLKKLRRVVIDKHKDVEASLYKDLRKCEFEAFATEVTAMIDEIDCAVENLESWTKPVDVGTSPLFGQAESRIYYEPYGTVLILNTWNYPFVLCFKPLVGALAAGNCCVVKPSEVAPATSKALADIINTAFDEEYCVAIECGVEGTTELLKERFDFIIYTGSSNVGRIVAQAAARYLTPTVLELGGKSPCIVDKSADIGRSVASICWGKFINAGQTCVAPDYIWVHKEVKERLVEALKNQIKAFYGEDIKNNADFGRIINKRRFEQLQELMKEGTIVFGGETDESRLFMSPTIIDGITWESKIMQEEVFGPILPVLTFENVDEIVKTLAGREKPLALYLYTTDKEVENLIINRVSYGGGCINATLMHMLNTNLPFGGVGNSGHGFYQGKWSIETFSHKKCILNRALTDEPSPLFPPYADHVKILKQIYLGEK
ncbi:MAG: aldehyde dehydrogenase family protein [Tannerella sp.]|jgi:aldehyde dehydrogenase (NAD+)|nr:aldehyde dehydrogenase family protein [Tannerella sp.]